MTPQACLLLFRSIAGTGDLLSKHALGILYNALNSQNGSCVPLTLKFLVQTLNAERGSLETAYKDSRQIFQNSDRMFEQILQISFKISFGREVFKRKFQDGRGRPCQLGDHQDLNLSVPGSTCCSECWMWGGKQKDLFLHQIWTN